MPASNADPIRVIEAAYRLDLDFPDWLRGVAVALRPVLDRGFGLLAYRVDFASEARFADVVSLDADPETLERSIPYLDPPSFARLYRSAPLIARASEQVEPLGTLVDDQPFFEMAQSRYGYSDVFTINVAPANAFPVQFAAPGPRAPWDPAERRLLGQIGGHIEAALRLRVAAEGSEAVLAPSGRIVHAEGRARDPEARGALSDAVRRAERSRGPMRREDPMEAALLWRALTDGRWSIVEQFDTDGRRFLVARRNDATVPRPSALSDRERQVIDLVRRGRSNKMAAYELGLAPSTVSALLRTALRKLGLRHRVELAGLLNGPSGALLPPQPSDESINDGP